tara:strand:+ start:2233 stop:2574 length:342 start_codon:yes stop_codon:yes gene_type:complete
MATMDGAIQQVISGPYLYAPCTEEVSDVTHYLEVSSGDIKPKKSLITQCVVAGLSATFDGLPSGLKVQTNGFLTVTDTDPLEIHYDVPGTYEIRLRGHVEYLDETLEVTVGDA